MDIFALSVLLLSCRIQVAATMELSPETLTVLRGHEARFTCSTSNLPWSTMLWELNGEDVLTISKEHGVLFSGNSDVAAEKSLDSKGDSWVFVLNSTKRLHEGTVTCELQGIEKKTANLFVHEKGSVKIFGETKMAFQGQSVLFGCRAAGWYPQPSLHWQVDGKELSRKEYNISREESEKGLFTVTSYLSVTAAKSSQVDCLARVSALPTPLNSSIRLTVVTEVVQVGNDCTVVLAVMGSLAAVLLLLLLCICIVLWNRQRRQAKSCTREVLRSDQPMNGPSIVAGATAGRVNLGYSSDGVTDAVYNELFMETGSQTDFVSVDKKVPDLVSSSSPSLHIESQNQPEESSKNIRRVTTV